jgi:uncharacterized membrane protein YuzA (DUF378 family)
MMDMNMKKSPLHMLCWWLLIIGGLNWGLVGFFGFDLVTAIFGQGTFGTKLVYDLVGLSAVYLVCSKMMMKNQYMMMDDKMMKNKR